MLRRASGSLPRWAPRGCLARRACPPWSPAGSSCRRPRGKGPSMRAPPVKVEGFVILLFSHFKMEQNNTFVLGTPLVCSAIISPLIHTHCEVDLYSPFALWRRRVQYNLGRVVPLWANVCNGPMYPNFATIFCQVGSGCDDITYGLNWVARESRKPSYKIWVYTGVSV